MNKKIKALIYTFVLCSVLFSVFEGKEVQASAKTPSCPKTQTVYCFRDDISGIRPAKTYGYNDFVNNYINIKNAGLDDMITDVKSSNAKISAKAYGTQIYCRIKNWKIGVKDGEKAKITFTVKQGSKNYKLSCTLSFKIFKSPFSSLKIGNKDYASAFNGASMKGITFPKSKFKITYKAAAGIKITTFQVIYKDRTSKDIKNGMTLNGKDIDYFVILFKNSKVPSYVTCDYYLFSQEIID